MSIEEAAAAIRRAYETGQPCAPIAPLLPEKDIAAAYAAQEINTKLWAEKGRRLVGRKIGLTSRAVQSQLGVNQPDYGMLFADMGFVDGDDIPIAQVLQPRIEAEVAFVLERDLRRERHTAADLIDAVAYALPALEIVGSRIADWKISILDTIADNGSSGLFFLGTSPVKLGAFDLALCGMTMTRAGEPVSTGAGRACLGNPLNAACWLADVMVAAGRPLVAGDIILSGALGPMVPLKAGDVIDARINGLGALRAAFH
jgi:2-keto-4-pentenoate hydratase